MQNEFFEGAAITPISLYLGFPKDEKLELRQAASIALAWSDAVEALFRSIEPGLQVRIELIDGDEGSLSLNTILRIAENALEKLARGADAYPRLKALAKGLAIIVVATPLTLAATDVYNAVADDDPEISRLSPETQQQIKDAFRDALDEHAAEAEKEQFSREVSRAEQVETIGVSLDPLSIPKLLFPSQVHRDYLEREWSDEGLFRDRILYRREVILVSPVLDYAERAWRFREPGMPEFSAVMRDKQFLEAMGRGAIHEELRFGIAMTVDIEVREKRFGETWIPKKRNIVRVHAPKTDTNGLFDPAG